MIVVAVAVAVVLTLPLLSVSCFYIALHCYDVTITNKTNKQTCKNNFWRRKKERRIKTKWLVIFNRPFNNNARNKQKDPSWSMQNINNTYLVIAQFDKNKNSLLLCLFYFCERNDDGEEWIKNVIDALSCWIFLSPHKQWKRLKDPSFEIPGDLFYQSIQSQNNGLFF